MMLTRKPVKVTVSVVLEPEQREHLEAIAKARGISVSTVVRHFVDAGLKKTPVDQN